LTMEVVCPEVCPIFQPKHRGFRPLSVAGMGARDCYSSGSLSRLCA
jgi:hypothetical protein